MAKIPYINRKFNKSNQDLICKIETISEDYWAQDLLLTVRQIFYQLVIVNSIRNSEKEYKRIGSLCTKSRLSGLLDWACIEDRTRDIRMKTRWKSPADILLAAKENYHMDMWKHQMYRPCVIVEKAALLGVLSPTCEQYDVPYLAAKGYPSSTIIHELVQNHIIPALEQGQRPVILYLGDHDPSGLNIPDSIRETVSLFAYEQVELKRIALNMDQVHGLGLPPNPAKETDKRYRAYKALCGDKCWELDAIPPNQLVALLKDELESYINWDNWHLVEESINLAKTKIQKVAEQLDAA